MILSQKPRWPNKHWSEQNRRQKDTFLFAYFLTYLHQSFETVDSGTRKQAVRKEKNFFFLSSPCRTLKEFSFFFILSLLLLISSRFLYSSLPPRRRRRRRRRKEAVCGSVHRRPWSCRGRQEIVRKKVFVPKCWERRERKRLHKSRSLLLLLLYVIFFHARAKRWPAAAAAAACLTPPVRFCRPQQLLGQPSQSCCCCWIRAAEKRKKDLFSETSERVVLIVRSEGEQGKNESRVWRKKTQQIQLIRKVRPRINRSRFRGVNVNNRRKPVKQNR